MNKRAQVTIFVIVAIVLVAGLVLLFVVFKPADIISRQDFDNPESFIDKCVRDSAREKVGIMLPQGGFLEPEDYKLYNDIKVSYLCKNVNFYEPCIVQRPLYITQLQKELKDNIIEDIEACFVELEDELISRNYEISGGDLEIEVVLKPKTVEIEVIRDFSFIKDGISKEFSKFIVVLKSPFYDLAYVANEIVLQESRFCNFDNVGFSLLYNEFDIRKQTLSDSTEVYSIKHKETGAETNIAVRGCVIPAGF